MPAVTYALTAIAVLVLVLLLSACASAPQPVTEAFNAAHARYTYSYRKSTPKAEMLRPDDGTANCTKFMMVYRGQLITRGVGLDRQKQVVCYTTRGEPHIYLLVDGKWAMDNRYTTPVPVEMNDCAPI